MTDLNDVILVGRITRDLGERDFGYINNGTAKAVLSVATNRSKKVGEEWQEEVSYFDVTIWGKTAENLKPYLRKGKQLLIKGFLKQDRWEKDGQKYSRVSIIAEHVELMGGKPKADDPDFISQQATPQQAQAVADAFGGEVTPDDFNEDIPF